MLELKKLWFEEKLFYLSELEDLLIKVVVLSDVVWKRYIDDICSGVDPRTNRSQYHVLTILEEKINCTINNGGIYHEH